MRMRRAIGSTRRAERLTTNDGYGKAVDCDSGPLIFAQVAREASRMWQKPAGSQHLGASFSAGDPTPQKKGERPLGPFQSTRKIQDDPTIMGLGGEGAQNKPEIRPYQGLNKGFFG